MESLRRWLFLVVVLWGALMGGADGALALARVFRFDHLGVGQGLPSGVVQALLQDRTGFLWIGTRGGLCRYDGRETLSVPLERPGEPRRRMIRALAEDGEGYLWVGTGGDGLVRRHQASGELTVFGRGLPGGLGGDKVFSLLVDARGVLWVGTEGGLARYDRVHGVFEPFPRPGKDALGLPSAPVRALCEDVRGRFWVGTDEGLALVDRGTGEVRLFRHGTGDPRSLGRNDVRALCADGDGALWVGTGGAGLDRLDPSGEFFIHHRPDPQAPGRLGGGAVRALCRDGRGNVWVGTWEGGLFRFDREKGRFEGFRHTPGRAGSLGRNTVNCLLVDRSGLLWIGLEGGGAASLNLRAAENFPLYTHDPGDPSGLASSMVLALGRDSSGAVWVGTDRGLDRIDRSWKSVRSFRPDPQRPDSLAGESVRAVLADSRGFLWVGTAGGGLQRLYLPALDRGGFFAPLRRDPPFRRFYHDPSRENSLADADVTVLLEDREGLLWVGTAGEGLDCFDPRKETFTHHRYDPDALFSLGGNTVTCLLEDRFSHLWVGTEGTGLARYDRSTDRFVRLREDHGTPSVGTPTCLLEDRRGRIWVGTEGGLRRLDRARGVLVEVPEVRPPGEDAVTGMLEDDTGSLWIATRGGLCRYWPETGRFEAYGAREGLQGEEFNYGACVRGSEGELIFGGSGGLNAIRPGWLRRNLMPPGVAITGVAVEGSPLDPMTLGSLAPVSLGPRDRSVTFTLAALDFSSPERNRFSVKLEGFETSWVSLGFRNVVTYTNLDPGSYALWVKAANADGVESPPERLIRLTVPVPGWRSWWAISLYALGSLGILGGYGSFRVRREERVLREQRERARALEEEVALRTRELHEKNEALRRSAQMLQMEVEERLLAQDALVAAKDAAESASRAKGVFLANVGHELRTPMNAILGFTDLLLEGEISPTQRPWLVTVRSAAGSLLRLLNDLLDLSKAEADRLDLEEVPFDPAAVLEEVRSLLEPRAREKGLAFCTEVDASVPPILRGDPFRLRQILTNLVDNSVKFTAAGHVAVFLTAQPEGGRVWLRGRVEDSGVGISPDQVGRLFEPFSQGDSSTSRRYGGSGLGLAIVRRLVDLMEGSLEVAPREEGGSIFSFSLSLGREEGGGEGKTHKEGSPELEGEARALPLGLRVLVAEDNPPNRRFLEALLGRYQWDLTFVEDGEEAWRLLAPSGEGSLGSPFDLALLDVQMPGKDGPEVARLLREAPGGDRLPLVALSAGAGEGERRRCLASGMDAFAPKPLTRRALEGAVRAALGRRGKGGDFFEARDPVVGSWGELFEAYEGQEGELRRLLEDFRGSLPGVLRALEAGVGKEDRDFLLRRIHRLKGSLGAFWMERSGALAREVEGALKRGDDEGARRGLALLALRSEEEGRALGRALEDRRGTR
ncbi:MAG TPA: two-component regulator propeller domain-containing protein [Synergistaceae bacterium]|nr:two-component regulator propeller domain-containing protein [Synergistaceae bacterium]HQH77874.1 two-component regulator propeller domain-containing protein [Synergistaceae bacterium]